MSDPARIGVGGPVGSGKTRLIEQLLPLLHGEGLAVAVITNDLVTTEDAERLQAGGLIEPELVVGVETGACPHTAIREDPSLNLDAAERLEREHGPLDVLLVESGGDNLAATFSADLVDRWLYVIDVAAGDDIPRKRGLGIVQADLLVVNKVDLAPHVGADLERMRADVAAVRPAKPSVFTDLRHEGARAVHEFVRSWLVDEVVSGAHGRPSAVERAVDEALVVRLSADLAPAELAAQALRLGHAFGNQHVPVEVADGAVVIPITTSRRVATETVRALGLDAEIDVQLTRQP